MILIVDCGSSKTKEITKIVDDFCECSQIPMSDFNNDLTDIEGIIISGAPILVTDVDTQPYLNKFSILKSCGLPVLGICFGHQLIGLLYGAQAHKMKAVRTWESIGLVADSPLFNRLPDTFDMMQDHCEAITIPPGFKLTASSDSCVNEAMQHVEHPIFGVQFHPEVSGNLGKVIIDNYIYQIKQAL